MEPHSRELGPHIVSHLDLSSVERSCPYCGEIIELLVETSGQNELYVEDCTVCCRPIQVQQQVDSDGETIVSLYHENEIVGT